MKKYFCFVVSFIFASLVLFGGAYVLHNMNDIFAAKIKAALPILNGTDAYTRYTNSSVPLQVKLYLFNVTNPEEVSRDGATPVLSQVGPFSITERRKKNVISISPDNTTLDYRLIRTYYLNESDSTSLDSIITLPNAPAFSAFYGATLKKYEEEGAADPVSIVKDYVGNQTIYLTRKAEDWLFKGIKLDWLDQINSDGLILDDQPPDNKFGLFYKKNGTWDEKADGTMTISTGVDGNFANIGKVVRWNKKNETSYWFGKSCNAIRGTDGQFFHPFVQKDEILEIFAPDLCRTLSIEYVKTTSIRTIELYRFGISSSFFKSLDQEDTKCYCTKRSHDYKKKEFCQYKGIIDVSNCRKKPIVISTPHFFNGDPRLRDAVQGLSPSAHAHDTYIDIEPMSGAVLRVRRRLQVNVEMIPSEDFPPSTALKGRIIHPFIWLDQSIVVPDELAQKLEGKLTKVVRLVRISCYAALISGPIMLIALLIFICKDIRTEDEKIKDAKKANKNSGDYHKVQTAEKPLGESGL